MKLPQKLEPTYAATGIALLLLIGGLGWWIVGGNASSQVAPPRTVAVAVAKAAIKDLPYRVEAPGSVQPVVSVSIRARVDSQVTEVLFADGAAVKAGQFLFSLDSRAIDAQLEQAQATLARDEASLVKAKRDVERYKELAAKGSTAKVTLDDALTNFDMLQATVKQDMANRDNLRVQRSYYDIPSPADGRIGISGVRPGTVVRAADNGTPLAVVNQMSPIYVTFGVPERYIADLREAGANAAVEATLQSGNVISGGHVAFIDNTVDPQTGTILVRALFDNKDEKLWPGTLANVRVSLRTDKNVVAVPSDAVQNGQRGTFVFIVENGVARLRNVTVARTIDGDAVITAGLNGDETIVTDGQLSLRDGSRVDIKRQTGA